MVSVATDYDSFDWLADEPASGATADTSATDVTLTAEQIATLQNTVDTYKSLGDPEQIAAQLAEYYAILEAAKHDQAQGAAANKEPPKGGGKSKDAVIRAELIDMFPALGKLDGILEQVAATNKKVGNIEMMSAQDVATKAASKVADLVGKSGYDGSITETAEDLVANRIYNTPSLMKRLHTGDFSVVEEVFKDIDKSFLSKHIVRKVERVNKNDLAALLSGSAGLSSGEKKVVDGSSDDPKLSQQDRNRKLGEEAFDLYTKIANARAQLGDG